MVRIDDPFNCADVEYLIPIIYLIIIASHAIIDAIKIKRGIIINHNLESAIYIIISILLGAVILIFGTSGKALLPLILFPIVTRAAFFDALLNSLTGRHWLYEGVPKPKSKESLWDRIERQIGLPTALYRIIYLLVYGIWLFYYFLIYG